MENGEWRTESDEGAVEPEFSIDDAFAKLTQKAGVPTEEAKSDGDGVTFTIEGMDDDAPEELENPDVPGNPEKPEEELDEDDYRRHYGIDEPYDPHLDLGDYVMPDTGILEDWD